MDIGSDMVSSENSREDADEAFKIWIEPDG